MHTIDPPNALLSWREEKSSAYLYHYVAMAEKNTSRETLFLNLANAAESQAKFWANELIKVNISVPPYKPDFRTRLVARLIPILGPRAIKPILAAMKVRGLSVYLGEMPGFPITHAGAKNHELKHRALGSGGAIRAGVFGVNDGLVSNASLILGIAGASSNGSLIILSGIAGLGAGAFSMAAGEYISMRSQRELFEYQIALERAELEEYPDEEAAELSFIYQARGLSKMDADAFAKKLLENKDHALNTLAREELGLNPDELGSPWSAAFSSFFSFVIGASIPLLPFLVDFGQLNLKISILATGVSLFIVGCIMSLFTGRNAFYSGFRMLIIGAAAGVTTYIIGNLVGVKIS